ncbi:glycosyltransferase [Methylobacterium brachythecii]|uniref:Glycosyl transferase family 1 n=1 Tax=Methylobacterium brachythecii TaxID=1176177 RepID=A0A7W6AGN3_9HYPH|nr:glycosyltransferase [Methylobacterium brachythecii]MBB3900884.1 glycosyltransferase involved in cell wall biosynthesis [Methylobacterium brachythecii]GLS46449.1 glycosyl transferase family 1 [Methylobacterium brachythecii]
MSQGPVPPPDDHGVADWPEGSAPAPLPDSLPDGRPWPLIAVTVVRDDGGAALAATLASLDGQAYPRLHHDAREVAAAETDPADRIDADYRLWLRAGDLLAPGALSALCLEAELSGAGAVAGLRVLFAGEVHGLDLLGAPGVASCGEGEPFDCGDILVSRESLGHLGLLASSAPPASESLWSRLAAAGVRTSRIGRPVLLRREPAGGPPPSGLSVASLTDLGHGGGAGIAHRRLGEALELAGHRIAHLRLADESPPAAAEWSDRFSRTEAAIVSGSYDLVLAGNLHGATRGGGFVGRLAAALPTAIALHDLFPLTGRCAHPKDCPVIASGCDARCPTPTEYPQLAPGRIAGAFAAKRQALAAPLLLANSDWTESRARALAPAGTAIAPIRLAFPTGVFRPRDRAALRRELGLPEHDVLVLFAAVIADAPDKGFDDLVATIAQVARPGVGFVAVGRLDDPGVFGLPGLHVPGLIGDEETLAQWYGACDVYLTASRLETLGQTPIEAGLCGTPTVAYRSTGLTSAVIDGVTGLLVEPREDALAEGLDRLIADAALRRRLGAFARIVLESRFSHAAAAVSLNDALAGWPGMPGMAPETRLRFRPEMLRHFAFARDRQAGARGLVAVPSRPAVRLLRRAKQAVLGRGMPLWMRRALYAAALLRRRVSR